MSKSNRMHTLLCNECLEVKPTGLSVAIYERWCNEIGKRLEIEEAIKSLTSSVDWILIKAYVCHTCNLSDIDQGEGVEVMQGEDVYHIGSNSH